MHEDKYILLAKLFLDKEILPDWAIKCLEAGYDSKSLRILASMSKRDSSSELDVYFQRSLKELGWDKIEEEVYLLGYAQALAQKILEDKLDPIETSRKIYRILQEADLPSEWYVWYEINEMLWDLEYFLKTGNQGTYFLSKEQLIDEIKKVADALTGDKDSI